MYPLIHQKIAEELQVSQSQVNATVELLDQGDSVPFIARYRKEVTGALTDTQLRDLQERLLYLRELEDRRTTILNSLAEQKVSDAVLLGNIQQADTKQALEDLYLPYKPKRRTKASIAIEAGLLPLAMSLLTDPSQDPLIAAAAYIDADKQLPDAKTVLEGARFILLDHFSVDADLLGRLREYLWQEGQLTAKIIEGKENEGAKFKDYYAYQEAIQMIPSHRALAILRGRKEGFLRLQLQLVDEVKAVVPEQTIAEHFGIAALNRPADSWLLETVRLAWRAKLLLSLETDLLNQMREAADVEAIKVFTSNLRQLLLAAPAGMKVTMGLDPGFRTGVKVVVIDPTGKLLEYTVIYPHQPQNQWQKSLATLAALCQRFDVQLISVGNGTASRETDQLVAELIQKYPTIKVTKAMVSEAGASIYSASALAAKEFPALDVVYRGAVSIARRLQDPLAELVKIDAKAIGVGQYQHDVNQVQLARSLDGVVEDCVNAVGVDLNTASSPLLARIAGLNAGLADQIVTFREQHGAFQNREALKKVPRLGDKAFEQAAGFLRITGGDNPLDASAVHPEAYDLVKAILVSLNCDLAQAMRDDTLLKQVKPQSLVNERFGLPTVQDVLLELSKPGRDPRPEFKTATFAEGVHKVSDLHVDMVLEGVVTNVTNFGAFVDVGVHQDGLVHISELADQFVKDPHQVVKPGQIVKVRVTAVDVDRQRVALTMRSGKKPVTEVAPKKPERSAQKALKNLNTQPINSTMADAFAKLRGES